MSFTVRFTSEARADLRRLYHFLATHDRTAARRALVAVRKGVDILRFSPFTCRKASSGSPFIRELVVPFGQAGYVLLFEVDDEAHVTVLAVRHQRESDFH